MRLKKDQHILLMKMSPNKLKVFISGSAGFIGKHLKKKLENDYILITPSRKKLNLNNISQVKNYLKICKPDIIGELLPEVSIDQSLDPLINFVDSNLPLLLMV